MKQKHKFKSNFHKMTRLKKKQGLSLKPFNLVEEQSDENVF
jgi:hypothetical protein